MTDSSSPAVRAPADFYMHVASPFNSRLNVDYTALARMPDFRKQLNDRLEAADLGGVEAVVHELDEGREEFNDGTGGRLAIPDSVATLYFDGPLELIDESAARELPAEFAAAPVLDDIALSFHEYGSAILTAWIRVRLAGDTEWAGLSDASKFIKDQITKLPALQALVTRLDNDVTEAAAGLLGDDEPLVPVAGRLHELRWSHVISLLPLDPSVASACADEVRELVIISDREFEDMCPSSRDFVYIGWLRSLLISPAVHEVVATEARPRLDEKGRFVAPETPTRLSVEALRRLQIDWLSADRLNRILAVQLRDYSRQRARLQRKELDEQMDWIERATVEVELFEAVRSLRHQMMSPYTFQVYERAVLGWRMDHQSDGYKHTLGALDVLYQQAKTELEQRSQRRLDFGVGLLSAFVFVSVVWDGWNLVQAESFQSTWLGTGTLGVLLVLIGAAATWWLRWR